MEIPIKEKPFVILNEYDGSNNTKKEINSKAKEGVDTIVIGNITDITIMKTSKDCVDNDIRNYIGNIFAHTRLSGLTYVPGERDFQIYTDLIEIIKGCKERKYLSNVTSMMYASDIMKIAEKIKNTRPEFMGLYKELAKLALNDSIKFLYTLKSLMRLGEQPIYSIRRNDKGQCLLISHANPKGKIIIEEKNALQLAEDAITIKDIAVKQIKLVQGSSRGKTHDNLKASINSILLKYLLDPDDPMRQSITDSMSLPYGEER